MKAPCSPYRGADSQRARAARGAAQGAAGRALRFSTSILKSLYLNISSASSLVISMRSNGCLPFTTSSNACTAREGHHRRRNPRQRRASAGPAALRPSAGEGGARCLLDVGIVGGRD